jgi:hypothetical protein
VNCVIGRPDCLVEILHGAGSVTARCRIFFLALNIIAGLTQKIVV